MSSKVRTLSNEQSNSSHRMPKPALVALEMLAQRQTRPAALIQQAMLLPGSPTPHEVLQLQRTIGNQAVGRLLARRRHELDEGNLKVKPAGSAQQQARQEIIFGQIGVEPVSSAARPVVQRQLSDGDILLFDAWLQKTKDIMELKAEDIAAIKIAENDLAGAKRAAIDRSVGYALLSIQKWLGQGSPRAKQKKAPGGKDIFTVGPPQTGKAIRDATASLAEEIFESYNPQTHLFVLLGNSPSVLAPTLRRAEADWVDLPLGGLSDAVIMKNIFGKATSPDPEKQRALYSDLFQKSPVLQKYISGFINSLGQSRKDIVLVDYTKSGVSVVAVADMLKAVLTYLRDPRAVKLFTFSEELPDEESLLTTQQDYDVVSAKPVGEQEKIFVMLTEAKIYKDKKLNLIMSKSLKIDELLKLGDLSYEEIRGLVDLPEFRARIFELL
jgi:hypothetical protein